LHRFPVDVLKIDRHFIAQIHTRSDNQEIVKAIIHLGIGLGLRVVAEGIEGLEELRFLSNQSCHFGQGFWFSAPIAAEQAAALLTYYQETCNDLNFCLSSPPPNFTDHLP
jgi:EAL domain-containing protein (putative c-di-GMP-specific phosphodiesterase class I)